MKRNSETIVDESGIEVLVGYNYETSESQLEEGHGVHEVGLLVSTELTSVEVVIIGTGIDILPSMNEKQKKHIISLLNYNDNG